MQRATHNGWLLETSHSLVHCPETTHNYANKDRSFRAWISNPARMIVGYGVAGSSEMAAVRMALTGVSHNLPEDRDTILGLTLEYLRRVET